MNEVKALLKQAWEKAKDSGVIIEQVDFNIYKELSGNAYLSDIKFQAEMKEGA